MHGAEGAVHLYFPSGTLTDMKFSLISKTPLRWVYALIGLAILLAGLYFFSGQSKNLGATLTITPTDFKEQVRVFGTVTATKDVNLGFASNGRIAGVYAKVGQKVTSGSVLAEIENGNLIANLSQKQFALASAQANLATLKTGTRPKQLAIASASVANAKSALIDSMRSAYTSSDDAIYNTVDSFLTNPRTNPKLSFSIANASLKRKLEVDRTNIESTLTLWKSINAEVNSTNVSTFVSRIQKYLTQVSALLTDANSAVNQGLSGSITSVSTLSSYATALTAVRTNVNSASATLTGSISALNLAEKNLALQQAGSTTETITAQKAVVAGARADVRSARASLLKTRVVAPFSGVITRMDAKVGEVVSPSTLDIAMQSTGVFEIDTYIPEVSIANVSVGDNATTTLDAYGASVAFPSRVIAVNSASTMKNGVPTYKTTLTFITKDPRIRSGMTTNVVIKTGELLDAVVIPKGAIETKNGTSYVSVINRGIIKKKIVTLGVSPALGQAHILSGLSKGDIILLTPSP